MKGSGPHCGRSPSYHTSWGPDPLNGELGGVPGLRWYSLRAPPDSVSAQLLRRPQWAPRPFQGQDSGPAAPPPQVSPCRCGGPGTAGATHESHTLLGASEQGGRARGSWFQGVCHPAGGRMDTCPPARLAASPVFLSWVDIPAAVCELGKLLTADPPWPGSLRRGVTPPGDGPALQGPGGLSHPILFY